VRTPGSPGAAGGIAPHATVAFPSTAAVTSTGVTLYTVNVLDAAGIVVAPSVRSGEGSASTPVTGIAPGTYTIEVVGERAASDPDTIDSDSLLNDSVTAVVAQLRAH